MHKYNLSQSQSAAITMNYNWFDQFLAGCMVFFMLAFGVLFGGANTAVYREIDGALSIVKSPISLAQQTLYKAIFFKPLNAYAQFGGGAVAIVADVPRKIERALVTIIMSVVQSLIRAFVSFILQLFNQLLNAIEKLIQAVAGLKNALGSFRSALGMMAYQVEELLNKNTYDIVKGFF